MVLIQAMVDSQKGHQSREDTLDKQTVDIKGLPPLVFIGGP